MRRSSLLLSRGVDAIEDILRRVYKIEVAKALDPLNRDDFLVIVARLAGALEDATHGPEVTAMSAALAALDVDWATLTPAGQEAIFTAMTTAYEEATNLALPAVREQFQIVGGRVMADARASAIRRFGFNIGTNLSQRDRVAEQFVRGSFSNFVRDAYGTQRDELSATAREIVARGLEQGLGRDAIARDLEASLGQQTQRSTAYWSVIATAFVNTARTTSQLNAFAEAGIQQYRFEAVMDEVTTDQCRYYHDKVFTVSGGISAMTRLTQSATLQELRATNPWVRVGNDGGGSYLYVDRGEGAGREIVARIDRSGFGNRDDAGSYSGGWTAQKLEQEAIPFPPLHANCRSTIVPEGPGF